MDKKRETEASLDLPDDPYADLQSMPELVPAADIGAAAPDEVACQDNLEVRTACSATEEAGAEGADPVDAGDAVNAGGAGAAVDLAKAKPTAAGKKMRALKFFITGWLIAFILWQLPPAIKWYKESPRSSTRMAPLVCASLGSAWIGDTDSAYAWQLAPITMSDSTSAPSEAEDKLVREQLATRHRQLMKITDHYLKNSSTDKSTSITSTIASIAAFSSGKPEEALRLLEPVAKTNPLIRELYAIYLSYTSDFKGALKNLDEAIQATKEKPSDLAVSNEFNIYLLKSDVYFAMAQPQQALDLLNSPDCIKAASTKTYGSSYNQTSRKIALATAYGRLRKADKMLQLAKSIGDSSNDALAINAVAYTLQNKLAAAREQVDKITDREGNRKELLLSCIFSKQGQFQQALKYADAAREKQADLKWLEQRLFLLNELGRYKEALSDSNNFSSLITWRNSGLGVLGKIPSIHADRALAFLQLGQAKQALVEAQLALRLNANSITALQVAADASRVLADQGAAAAYEARIKDIGETPIYR